MNKEKRQYEIKETKKTFNKLLPVMIDIQTAGIDCKIKTSLYIRENIEIMGCCLVVKKADKNTFTIYPSFDNAFYISLDVLRDKKITFKNAKQLVEFIIDNVDNIDAK